MSKEKRLADVLAYIAAALSNCALYSPQHPAIEEYARRALAGMDDLFVEETFTLTLLAESLLFNDVPVSHLSSHMQTVMRRLRTKGIDRIVIKKGLTLEELTSFIGALALREVTMRSSSHIVVGLLEIRFKAEEDITTLMDQGVARINEVYGEVSRFRRLDVQGLEDVVVSFITALKKEANVLRNLSPVREHSLYTYVHAANVSVLTIFQAEALGMRGEILHDAGIAGLLHDVGKLFVRKSILEKTTALDEHDWQALKLHPQYGAQYLSKARDVPQLAVIAAYEHHMKYNGMGYPQSRRTFIRQHIISQIVAIADFFDALRTSRSYRSSFDTAAVIALLREGSGADFNPGLVDNIILSLKRIKAL